jgi:uncharacterized NAD(P)/FAD-binding protein YdhS
MGLAHAAKQGPTVAVIGGGVSGSLFALKFARAQPNARVILIERSRRVGRGLAYGACTPHHLLNVPVARMEVGLTPGFTDWLRARTVLLGEALVESGGDLAAAFVPRELFGAYLEERVLAAVSPDPRRGFAIVRGEAVRLLDFPRRGVLLGDGREIAADRIVLATGNLPPRPPRSQDDWLYDTQLFVPDPWADDAFEGLAPEAPVVLLGSGLTMVDVALKLAGGGHVGPIHAVSRHGLLPLVHRSGGEWQPFHDPKTHVPPLTLMRRIRSEARRAEAGGVPWQRVMDTMRPAVARVWHGWSVKDRAQFLRHLRARWDVHRHRMAPRVAARIAALRAGGQLHVMAGRVQGYHPREDAVDVEIAARGAGRTQIHIQAARVINCTGPRSDMDRLAIPLLADLRRRGLIAPDPLGLGIETQDCAALGSAGHLSPWLYALGPLTRPSWWEIVAVPEINAQVDRLIGDLSAPRETRTQTPPLLAELFADLGSGI